MHAKPFTGRVYIFFSQRRAEPRLGPGWFDPESFVSLDVVDWQPDTPLDIAAATENLLAFPASLGKLELSGYRAQAVVRFNPYDRQVGQGAGNGYSDVVSLAAFHDGQLVELPVTQIVEERTFVDTRWSRLLKIRSELLSKFHQRDVFLQAGVILPASYFDERAKRYPTIYRIPGFGGDHFSARVSEPVAENNRQNVEFLRVILDPSCPWGHHVFADSATNGPVGQALVRELIPAFEREFRAIAKPTARFLTGHSSGGWSSLWLQISHPTEFGGTWSTAPDPVDFRDFQQANIYRPGENMYVFPNGNRRPLAHRGDEVLLWWREFDQMEVVLGHGGQLRSFEAVFSPLGPDGFPRALWSRATGQIDPQVAQAWRKYDIRLVLEQNWLKLAPKLQGKIHLWMGDQDTFYLAGAASLLKQSLARFGSDAQIEIVPDQDHFTLWNQRLALRIREEMVEAFLKSFPDGLPADE